MRILIVDDHEIFLTALKILLESNPMIHHVTILSDPNKIESELTII